jgi:hypothetical protein
MFYDSWAFSERGGSMAATTITRQQFLEHRQGRTFADVLNDPEQPFEQALAFFNDPHRQRRMEESEIHHSRPPLAGVVRELESVDQIDRFLGTQHPQRTKRLRQAVGVLVRMIMERRGWKKTGKKGSLGVRAARARHSAKPGSYHNTGGLAFWFLRAERYELTEGMPYRTVRSRRKEYTAVAPRRTAKRTTKEVTPDATRQNGSKPSPNR